jgi:two-component system, chemotaxis family, protein-glutamate methylesterase/glutaminase
MNMTPLRVLIVDDSALYRQLVRNVLRDIPDIDVVGSAKNGAEALELVQQLQPDLMTLDIQMPDVDGLEVLRMLRKTQSPTKAVMLSSLTANGAQITTDALLEGAFDFIHKPGGPDGALNRQRLQEELLEKVTAFRASPIASGSRSRGAAPRHVLDSLPRLPTNRSVLRPELPDSSSRTPGRIRDAVLVIGTSTGGPVALGHLLPELCHDFPIPILIVQHMPPGYTNSLAQRLNQRSQLQVMEAADGLTVASGHAYIAPGGYHLKLQREGNQVVLRVTDDPPEHGCRPSIDYLLRSAVEIYGSRVIALILTGMGRAGTEGCREVKRRGGFIAAQHAEDCAVYGMPKSVAEARLADVIMPLHRIPAMLNRRMQRGYPSLDR